MRSSGRLVLRGAEGTVEVDSEVVGVGKEVVGTPVGADVGVAVPEEELLNSGPELLGDIIDGSRVTTGAPVAEALPDVVRFIVDVMNVRIGPDGCVDGAEVEAVTVTVGFNSRSVVVTGTISGFCPTAR